MENTENPQVLNKLARTHGHYHQSIDDGKLLQNKNVSRFQSTKTASMKQTDL